MSRNSRWDVAARLMSIIVAVVLLTACSSGDGASGRVPDDQQLQPTKADPAWVTHETKGVTVSTPAGWEEAADTKSPGPGATRVGVQTPVNTFGTRGFVQLVVLDQRKKRAGELVSVIESQVRATIGATDVADAQIEWPGAEEAWLINYVAHVPHGGETAPHPAKVMVLDLPGGGQAQVTVTVLKGGENESALRPVIESTTTDGRGSPS